MNKWGAGGRSPQRNGRPEVSTDECAKFNKVGSLKSFLAVVKLSILYDIFTQNCIP